VSPIVDPADSRNGEWYRCNDEQVTKKRERPKKRIRLDSFTTDTTDSSRDAYMLVYTNNEETVSLPPPSEILARVEADNRVFALELDERARK